MAVLEVSTELNAEPEVFDFFNSNLFTPSAMIGTPRYPQVFKFNEEVN